MPRASATMEDNALQSTGGAFTSGTNYYVSLHTSDPSTTGANEATGGSYARQSTQMSAPSAGVNSNSSALTFNVNSGTYSYFGIWTAASGGTYLIGGALTSAITLSAAGTIAAAAGALTVTAS